MNAINKTATLSPKEVMQETGLSIHALRYYEKLGLLGSIQRTSSGHRIYGEEDVHRIRFVKRMRTTGMPIKMLQCYVSLLQEGQNTLDQRREILEIHRNTIAAQMDELQSTMNFIDRKLDLYYSGRDCLDGLKEI